MSPLLILNGLCAYGGEGCVRVHTGVRGVYVCVWGDGVCASAYGRRGGEVCVRVRMRVGGIEHV